MYPLCGHDHRLRAIVQAAKAEIIVSAASAAEFARVRADMGTRITPEQLQDLDTAIQELQLDAMLRKAMALRSRVFINDVLANLEKLAPVYRDTVRYLLKVGDRKIPEKIGSALVQLLTSSRVGFLPFVQVWTFEAFSQQPALCGAEKALELAESCHPLVRDRLCAVVARAYGMSDWVRERKENWDSNGPWTHRAILWAGSVLPPDERRHWLKSAFGHPRLLTSSVAKIAAG